MKHGWSLQDLGTSLHLVRADKAMPVSFKRNSLYISGNIRMLDGSGISHARAVQLKESLPRVTATWTVTRLSAGCYAIRTSELTVLRVCGRDPCSISKFALVSYNLGKEIRSLAAVLTQPLCQ